MEANLEPKSDVLSAPILIDSDWPNQLVQSAYQEVGHMVADVGLLGELCYDVRAFETRLRVAPIVRVKWSGVVNASILDGSRIAPSAIPIISPKDDNEGDDVEEFVDLATDDESHVQPETLSASPKYLRPSGRTWRTDVSQLLKLNDVEERVCLKRAKIYALIETGDFPAPVKLTPGRSVWLADEIAAWVQRKAEASRKAAGGDDDQ